MWLNTVRLSLRTRWITEPSLTTASSWLAPSRSFSFKSSLTKALRRKFAPTLQTVCRQACVKWHMWSPSHPFSHALHCPLQVTRVCLCVPACACLWLRMMKGSNCLHEFFSEPTSLPPSRPAVLFFSLSLSLRGEHGFGPPC